jgi:peptide/nickel transport system substrate-binding protein
MKAGRAAAVAVLAVLAMTVAACTSAPRVVKHSAVVIAVADPFTSSNAQTSFGATTTNEEIVYATNSNFVYHDDNSQLHADTSFGTVRGLSSSPLRVNYAVNPGVKWSDGVGVSNADLLLAWAAGSGALNTTGFDPRKYVSADGRFSATFPKDAVWFDDRTPSGLQYAKAQPTLGANHRSITLDYDSFYIGWKSALEIGLPAHIVAEKAFGLTSATEANAELVAAITTNDTPKLAALSRVWNSAFNVTAGKLDPALAVGDGPYKISALHPDGSVTLTANKLYSGTHRPRIATITTRVLANTKTQVAALNAGAVDVITPPATAATVKALINLKKITISSGYDASFEHLDLQFSHSKSGTFDNPVLRAAFLKAVPRAQIVNQIAGSIQEETSPRASFMLFPGTAEYAAAIEDNGSQAYETVDVPGASALLKSVKAHHPTVCILFDSTNPIRAAEYALIKASEDRAGFNVTNCSTSKWLSRLGKPGAYDASIFAWRSTSSAVTMATPRLHSGTLGQNYNFYSSAVTDKLLDTLAQTTGSAQQNEIMTEIDRQLYSDGYGLPLFQLPTLTAYRTTVTGIKRSPFAPGVFWNIWDWRPTA